MEVIEFRAKEKGALSAQFHLANPSLYDGPKPNFDDPHSRDFPAEPTVDKTLCDFLNMEEQRQIMRFVTKRGLKAEYEDNTISLSKIASFADKNASVQSLFQHKPSYLPIAEITCFDNAAGQRTHYSYTLQENSEVQRAVSFISLLTTLDRHLETGSPDLPEPEFWR